MALLTSRLHEAAGSLQQEQRVGDVGQMNVAGELVRIPRTRCHLVADQDDRAFYLYVEWEDAGWLCLWRWLLRGDCGPATLDGQRIHVRDGQPCSDDSLDTETACADTEFEWCQYHDAAYGYRELSLQFHATGERRYRCEISAELFDEDGEYPPISCAGEFRVEIDERHPGGLDEEGLA